MCRAAVVGEAVIRTVFVIQRASLAAPRTSESDLWRDYPYSLEYANVEEVACALTRFRRSESQRTPRVRLRAVERVVSDEWVVGL